MAKVISSYECLFIVDVENEEVCKSTVNKFTTLMANNGEIVEIDEWGKRRLAYPINDKPEGYYVVVTFKAGPEFPAELERLAAIDENMMRILVLKLDHEAVKKAQAEVPAEAEVEAAPAVEAEAAPVEEAAE